MTGIRGRKTEALPSDEVKEIIDQCQKAEEGLLSEERELSKDLGL
jgi:hypothetical protein